MAKKKPGFELSNALVYPFEDKDWIKKTAVASLLVLLSFIPIIPMVLFLGYLAEIMRRIVVEKEEPSLPEWDNISDYFQSGFQLFIAGAVYMIPATILIVVGYAGMFVPVVAMELGGLGEGEAIGLMLVGYLLGFGFMGLGALISMITGIFLPVAGTHLIASGELSAAFKFGEIWKIFRSNWAGFLVAFMVLIGGGVILYYGTYFLVVTVILCCLYPFALCIASAYLGFVGAALFGDAYRVGAANLPVEK